MQLFCLLTVHACSAQKDKVFGACLNTTAAKECLYFHGQSLRSNSLTPIVFFYLFPKNKTKSFPHQSDSTTCLCNNNGFSFKAPMEQCQKRAYKAFGIICGGISKRSAQNMQGHSATRYCSLYLHVKLFFSATFHSFITYRYVCLLY